MKKSINILALTCILFAGSFTASFAQDKKKVIADETTVSDTKTSFKIETSNDAIFKRIQTQYGEKLTRYMVTNKKDRSGKYCEYVLYFKLEDKNAIMAGVSKY